MSGYIVGGVVEEAPGLVVLNWRDSGGFRAKLGEDVSARSTTWVRNITLHTTRGTPGGKDQRAFKMRPGLGPAGNAAEANVRYWSGNGKAGAAHCIKDYDAQMIQVADLLLEQTPHAGKVNGVSIGIEIVQGETEQWPKGYVFVYEGQLDALVVDLDWMTRRFGIQRQFHAPYHGSGRPVPRIAAGAENVVGLYGHRDQTTNRGPGDPGPFIFEKLKAAGYELFDFAKDEDLNVWKTRQAQLNQLVGSNLTVDGVPGPGTVVAIQEAARLGLPGFTHPGAKYGMWIPRPLDERVVV